MRKMHDSDSYISEIECPKRTEKSCIALKSCASVANNNMEHIVICPLHATSMPINQNHNKMAILAHRRKVTNRFAFGQVNGEFQDPFLRYHWIE